MPLDQILLSILSGTYAAAAGALPQATLAFEYNPTSDANLTLSGASVQSATDMTGNSRNATATGVAGPDREIAGINGVNVFSFVGVNNDSLNVQNALSVFNNVPAIGMDGVILISSFAATYNVLKIHASVSTNNRFTVQVLTTTGKIRVTTRRVGADTTVNTDSSFTLNANVQSYVSVQVDYVLGVVRFQIDDNIETVPINGTQSWSTAPGLGFTENVDSTTAPVFGRVSGGAVLNGKVGWLRAWTGRMTEANFASRRSTLQSTFATPLRRVAFDSKPRISANRHWLSTGGLRDGIPVSGTVISGGDGTIQIRLLDAATRTTEAPGWGLTNMGSSSGGVWSFMLDNVPDGHWVAAARKSTDNATAEVIDSNVISVTPVIVLLIGQSNIRKGFGGESRKPPYASSARAVPASVSAISVVLANTDAIERGLFGRRFSHDGWCDPTSTLQFKANSVGTNEPKFGPTGSDVGGAGLSAFLQRYKNRNGYYPGALALSIGGGETTGIPSLAWLENASNDLFLQSVLTQADGPDYEYSHIVYGSGEGECNTGDLAVVNAFGATMQSILALHRTRTGNASLKMFLQIMVRRALAPNVTDQIVDAMLDQQLALLDDHPDDFVLFANTRHLGNYDNQHIIEAGYGGWTYPQFEASLAQEMGVTASGGRGPRITSATLVAGERKATLNVTHDGGSDLIGCVGGGAPSGTPDNAATGLSQFGGQVWVDGAAQTITAAYLSAGKVVLEWTGGAPLTSGGTFGARHQRGAFPDITMCVYDNLGWPMQPTRSSAPGNGGIQIFEVP